MRALAIPWPEEELAARYRGAASAGAARRYQALWLRKKGLSAVAAAEAVGATAETLRQWVTRATAEGLDALGARKAGSGATPKLTPEQQEQVLAWADADPRATMPALRRRIRAVWDVVLSETQVWALVRARGFRRVVPRRRHYQADPAAQAAAEKNWACCAPGSRGARGCACCSPPRRGGG
jgi:transposase